MAHRYFTIKKTKQNKTEEIQDWGCFKKKMKKILDVANSTWVSREMPLTLRF